MEEETMKIINNKIRKLLENDDSISFNRAIDLIKALNNPLNCG